MTKSTARILVVPASGLCRFEELPDDEAACLQRMQQLVGGWIEGITGDTWHAYVDEEGRLKRPSAFNLKASLLLTALGRRRGTIVGDALFAGNGPAGAEADIPETVLAVARRLGFEIEEQ